MANEITNTNKYELNIELALEPILISLNKDNYKDILTILSEGIKRYDNTIEPIVTKYIWLVESQLQGNIPSFEIIKRTFDTLNFDNVVKIDSQDELMDYVYLFISQKKHRFIGDKLLFLSDKVRKRGLSDEDTNDIYEYLADSENDNGYESITDNFLEIYEKQEKLVGISFLCPELDNLTGGITPGQICTILGAPGSMKTTYSSNIAYNALKSGKNVLYVSLEEPSVQLFSKWLSRCSVDTRTPIPQKDIVQRTLDKKQREILFNQVYTELNNYEGKLFILDEQQISDYSVATLESKFKVIDKQAKERTGHGIDLLVVDHIQLLKFAIADKDTIAAINYYVSFFRRQSLNWLHEKRQISVILLSQANRTGYDYAQKHDGLYQSQHVAEASEVERASAYIISVYTDSMTQLTNQLVLGAVKLRGAPLPTNVIPVYADGAVYQVGNVVSTASSQVSTGADFSSGGIDDILGGV